MTYKWVKCRNFYLLICIYIFQVTLFLLQSLVNIVFDRVGRKDPVTKGMEIAVHWLGFDIDVQFWSQHISFFLVGCIIFTSIRGFILTLTRVSVSSSLHILKQLMKTFVTYCIMQGCKEKEECIQPSSFDQIISYTLEET